MSLSGREKHPVKHYSDSPLCMGRCVGKVVRDKALRDVHDSAVHDKAVCGDGGA